MEYDLHCMKSRPTKDRKLPLFFDKITAPKGVETIHENEEVDVLRVSDFLHQIPARQLYLPADKFYCDDCGTVMREIETRNASTGSSTLHLNEFETCIAAGSIFLLPKRG
mgnify:CR=1 FL=1